MLLCRFFLLLFAGVLLVGCGGLPSGVPTEAGFATLVAQGVAATLTSEAVLPIVRTAPPTHTPQPAGPSPTVAAVEATGTPAPALTEAIASPAVPTSAFFADARYELSEEQVIGGYAVRIWHNASAGADALGADRMLTLAKTGFPPITIDFFSALDPLTGTDITRDGTLELIVNTYTGGAHCCFGTIVYSLSTEPAKVLETRPSNCPGQFTDLDGDGIFEHVTCDDSFAYAYCPFASSPTVTVVMAFDAARGYAPASPDYGQLYDESLETLIRQAETGVAGSLGEWDSTTKCSVLPAILALLYSGRRDQAWSELERLYPFADRETFRMQIEQTAGQSPLFVAP